MSDISTLRRVLTSAGVFTGVALAAVGCSSSSGSASGGSTAAGGSATTSMTASTAAPGSSDAMTGASSAPAMPSTTADSSSAAGSGGGAAAGGADKGAACADIGNLITKSGEIGKTATSGGGVSAHFDQLKSLYGDLAQLGTKIASEAPAAISSDAKTFATAINTLDDAVKGASSAGEVQSKVLSDPKLKSASTSFQSAVTNLIKWRTTNCG